MSFFLVSTRIKTNKNNTLTDHIQLVERMMVDYFNWSVWEHEKAKCGDRFFLVRVGEGKNRWIGQKE